MAGGVVLGLGAAVTLAAWSDGVFADGNFQTGEANLLGSQAAGADDNLSSVSEVSPEIVPPRKVTDKFWMGRYITGPGGDLEIARASHWMSYPQPTSLTATTTTCFGNPAPSPRLVAHQNTLGYTYSIAASDASSTVARVTVAGFRSTAQCFADGSSSAVINDSGSTLQLADELATRNYSFSHEESIKAIIPASDDSSRRYDGTSNQWMRHNPENGHGRLHPLTHASTRRCHGWEPGEPRPIVGARCNDSARPGHSVDRSKAHCGLGPLRGTFPRNGFREIKCSEDS
ncbi:SipW-dependent-type signal peptide-containing protein [Rhodococcus sp. IEGM 1408]|uniref:SipW-dependent-type signal peptide-containing protein n=1 Tax=Rhodococcus sp. IEGM 1408 TaxID=3082220 RepID=UPI0029552A1B|nr:SipW-dependent-type signal peptide-containing protein [Rhodococcus sp. IEGM 1408]MDV8001645.1 SipW-dependent-type signal peptide-containing protein [Rhodococcus sp. IEGM 1408]